MPVYDFRCSSCSHQFEARAGFEDDTWQCPACGTRTARRQFTPTPYLMIPRSFKRPRNWAMPPKDSPRWETMVAQDSVRPEKPETLRQYVEKELG